MSFGKIVWEQEEYPVSQTQQSADAEIRNEITFHKGRRPYRPAGF